MESSSKSWEWKEGEFSPVAGHPPAIELELARVRPLLIVGAYVGLALLIAWLIVQQLPNVIPQAFPQRLAGLGYVEDVQGRVDSALRDAAAGNLIPGQPTLAFIGFSGGQEGIDLKQLAEDDQAPIRYLGLCGASDATIRGLEDLASPLFESNLDVDCIVMAISPFHLVVRPFRPSLDRSAIRYSADRKLLAGRRQLLHLLGHEYDPRYQDVDAWRPMQKQYLGVVPDSVMQLRMSDYESRGYFRIENYDRDGRQGTSLLNMIRKARSRGSRVAIMLMPTHPVLIERLPPEAADVFRGLVAELNVPILDYQNAIGAHGFHDHSHLNTQGRREFTEILACELPQLLPNGN